MYYNKLGNTDLFISMLGFGAMRLPIGKTNPDFGPAIALIQSAIQRGINFFDVGTFYCHYHCEEAFGLATQHVPLEQLLICGKNSSHQTNSAGWLAQLQNTLRVFHRQYFDLYFIHYLTLAEWQDFFVQKNMIAQIEKAKQAGLIRYLGFSSHDTPGNIKILLDTGYFSAVILPFNLLQQQYAEVMSHAYERGSGVIAMNPLAGGALAKSDLYVEQLAGNKREEIAGLALNYVFSQPFIHSVLSGMESKAILDANLTILKQKRLTPTEILGMNEAIAIEKAKRYLPCTACQYCMPCIKGIDIPGMIKIVNNYNILRGKGMFFRDYAELAVNAECCVQCGFCKEKCPQGIDIPGIMQQACELFIGNVL